MKKTFWMIVLIIAMVFCGCSKGDISQKDTQKTQTAVDENKLQTNSTLTQEIQENWNKYEVTNQLPEFSAAINANPIDPSYQQEKMLATTAGELVELEKKYIDLWKKEMESSEEQLMLVLTETDAEYFQANQNNWVQAIDSDFQITDDILRGEEYDLHLGLTFSQLLLSEKRELYRERTIKIKYLHYLIESNSTNSGALQSVLFQFNEE